MKQGWEIKKLGEVATYVNGYAFKPEQWVEEGMPIIRIQNLNNPNAPFNYCNIDVPTKYIVQNGDILISWSASLGVYECNNGDAYLNQHIFKVVFDKLDINKYYLKYAVSAKLNDMQKQLHGATMKHIVKKDFDNTKIPVPSIAEQEKIVAELDCLSGIIEKKKQQLKEYDALAQSIFYEMFGDPVENEMGWEVKTLGEVCKFSQGVQVDLPLQSTEKKSGWNRFLRIVDYTTCNTDIRYVNISNDKYFVNFDDVVVVRYGASAGFVGIEKEGILANNLFKLNHDRNKLNYKYLYYLLSTDYYKDFVKDIAFGAAMPALSFNSFKNFNIYIPPIALQQEFADKIETIEKQKELIKKSISETENLFNARMDYYFNK